MDNKNNTAVSAVRAFYVRHKKAVTVWVFILAVLFLLFRGFIQNPQIDKNREEIARLEAQIEYEKARMEEVEALKTKVNSDEYIEKMAREKLGMIKENEKVFIDISQQN